MLCAFYYLKRAVTKALSSAEKNRDKVFWWTDLWSTL